ncbi:MAG: hypothetical protein HQL37_10825 [Alphaproteobacteria bacterium]|nr:hypothetical protein [Alphaproteobacteria bacterium]
MDPGSSWPVFLGFTVVGFGWLAFMTGQALAVTWRPMWQVVPYGLLLGLTDRFFVHALFDGVLLSVPGLILATVLLLSVALLAYQVTLARLMVRQYPWLYERAGLLFWRERR